MLAIWVIQSSQCREPAPLSVIRRHWISSKGLLVGDELCSTPSRYPSTESTASIGYRSIFPEFFKSYVLITFSINQEKFRGFHHTWLKSLEKIMHQKIWKSKIFPITRNPHRSFTVNEHHRTKTVEDIKFIEKRSRSFHESLVFCARTSNRTHSVEVRLLRIYMDKCIERKSEQRNEATEPTEQKRTGLNVSVLLVMVNVNRIRRFAHIYTQTHTQTTEKRACTSTHSTIRGISALLGTYARVYARHSHLTALCVCVSYCNQFFV